MSGQRVVLVAAVADNGVIGRDGDIPWSIPADLRHFREVTTGHTVLMGRRTFGSIGHPLPFRTNLVLTRDPEWSHDGVLVAHTIEQALERSRGLEGDLMVIGGAEIYALAMPYADVHVLTEVHLSPEGDTHYPSYDPGEWVEERREPHLDHDPPFEYVWLVRR